MKLELKGTECITNQAFFLSKYIKKDFSFDTRNNKETDAKEILRKCFPSYITISKF